MPPSAHAEAPSKYEREPPNIAPPCFALKGFASPQVWAGLLSVSIRSKLEAKNRWNRHW